jgi:hypothetical protein
MIWSNPSAACFNALRCVSPLEDVPMQSAMCERLGIEVPIIQAPLGGVGGPALAGNGPVLGAGPGAFPEKIRLNVRE